MNRWLKYFVYISVAFLIYYLWKADFLFFPEIENYFFLVLSFVFLLGGFATKSLVWFKTLNFKKLKVSYKNGFVSVGLSELGKYIPGKLWIILGRAGYMSQAYGHHIKNTSYISFYTQIITIWTGLLAGGIGFFFIDIPVQWKYIFAIGFLTLSIILFLPKAQVFGLKGVNFIFKKEITLPVVKVRELLALLPCFLVHWLLLIPRFALLLPALPEGAFQYIFLPAFPLSITLGILAIISPGGLGIREGVLVFWMHKSGMDTAFATSIAMTARLWMLAGELFVFISALFLKPKSF